MYITGIVGLLLHALNELKSKKNLQSLAQTHRNGPQKIVKLFYSTIISQIHPEKNQLQNIE